jgi:hypothetical protein
MRILNQLLRFLMQSGESSNDKDAQHARVRSTERVIERYDQMLNSAHAPRQRGTSPTRESETSA